MRLLPASSATILASAEEHGLTDFKDILGFNVAGRGTRAAFVLHELPRADSSPSICRAGRGDLKARQWADRGCATASFPPRGRGRTRFLGNASIIQAVSVNALGLPAGVAGAIYVPQVGIINPSAISTGNSIEAVIWGAVGGSGTLVGARAATPSSSITRKPSAHRVRIAPYWMSLMGRVHYADADGSPRAIVGSFKAWWEVEVAERQCDAARPAI